MIQNRSEHLGKTFMKLTEVENNRFAPRWYPLKLLEKGVEDRGAILLQIEVVYNHFAAARRTTRPAEVWPEPAVSALSAKVSCLFGAHLRYHHWFHIYTVEVR